MRIIRRKIGSTVCFSTGSLYWATCTAVPNGVPFENQSEEVSMASLAINKFELQFIDPTISFGYGSATCVSGNIDLFGCSSERSNCQTTWGTIGTDGGLLVGQNDEHGAYTVRLQPGAVVSHQFVPWRASAQFPIEAVLAVQPFR
jgi:hypothetical protein